MTREFFEKKRKLPSLSFFLQKNSPPQSPLKKKEKLFGSYIFEEEKISSPTSATSTDSGMDALIVSMDGNKTFEIIDEESNEVQESRTNQRYFASSNAEMFYNGHAWHRDSLKTSIELSVCGGNIYALLMGRKQPLYDVGVGEDEVNPVYYRISSKVNFLAEGEAIFTLNKTVDGLIFSLIISYFLGDYDISNVVAVEDNDGLTAVRIDPEYSFSNYCSSELYNQHGRILSELNFLLQHQAIHDPSDLRFDSGVEFFKECFTHHLLKSKSFLQLFSSDKKVSEAFLALKTIAETPFEQFADIIDKTISNQTIAEEVKKVLKSRQQLFSRCHDELKDHFESKLTQSQPGF